MLPHAPSPPTRACDGFTARCARCAREVSSEVSVVTRCLQQAGCFQCGHDFESPRKTHQRATSAPLSALPSPSGGNLATTKPRSRGGATGSTGLGPALGRAGGELGDDRRRGAAWPARGRPQRAQQPPPPHTHTCTKETHSKDPGTRGGSAHHTRPQHRTGGGVVHPGGPAQRQADPPRSDRPRARAWGDVPPQGCSSTRPAPTWPHALASLPARRCVGPHSALCAAAAARAIDAVDPAPVTLLGSGR
jgi:hypothetical protein